ncbi:MAG: patatin [Friedmanniella sp.]|nr:patatin [Friedmanniella sp.]
MTRSLVCAGGGMRVAWQAGVVRALEEDGLTFDHVDGTSGGILTAAMMLSGVSGAQMCERWSGLDVRAFGSALPLADYLTGPWSLPALGDADGLLTRVFPALGIDVGAIRSAPTAGTFNVADFGDKRCLAVDAVDVDAELLAAGMSLPLFMTPLRRDGRVYTDAVWIRDANVAEALRRGADEIWLLWCIGNTGTWGDGPLEQYVHMIEMSAMGALLADFDAAAQAGRSFVLHVVRPDHPLPLDPEFYLGRISADDLVAMGYRDARGYLDHRTEAGVVPDRFCTQMTDTPPGVRFRERLHGEVDGEPLVLHLVSVLPSDPADGPVSTAGFLDHAPWGGRCFLADGGLGIDATSATYRARVRVDGRWESLVARRDLVDDPGPDAWSDATTVSLQVGDRLSTTVRLGVRGAAALLASVEPVGVHGPVDRAAAVAQLGRRFLRGARKRYAG